MSSGDLFQTFEWKMGFAFNKVFYHWPEFIATITIGGFNTVSCSWFQSYVSLHTERPGLVTRQKNDHHPAQKVLTWKQVPELKLLAGDTGGFVSWVSGNVL